jgi:flagellar basal body-associated protein FliL
MFNFKKAKKRNIFLMVLAFLAALGIVGVIEYFVLKLSILQMVFTLVVLVAVIVLYLLTLFSISFLVNKKDRKDLRIAKTESTHRATNNVLAANGVKIDTMSTERTVAEIDADLKRLQNERFHAAERDAGIKVVKKFAD